MSKPSSTDLFKLIKSLNKNEKGYVKKFSFGRQESSSHFIKLFDAIDRQNEYNEKELLKKEKYIRQLPRLKIYLYEHILSALDSYYSKKNIDLYLRKILSRVYLLFEKGLYDQCIKQLYKAKELAEHYEKFSQLLEIYEWERTLMIEKQLVSDFAMVAAQEEKTLKQIENLSGYKKAYEQISKLYAEIIYIRTQGENRLFTKIISTPAFKNISSATSLQSKILFLKTLTKYYAALDDRKKYIQLTQLAVNKIEEHPDYIDQHIMQYIKLLNNLMATLSEHGRFAEYEKYHSVLKKIPSRFPVANTQKIKTIISMRITIRNYFHAVNTARLEEAFQWIKEIEKMLVINRELISSTHKIMFMYQVAYSYFINGNFRKALQWVNKILTEGTSPDKLYFHCFARIMGMVVHLELGNFNLLESQLKSNIRFFSKKNKLYTLESVFFQFIKNYLKSSGTEKQNKLLFTAFKNALKKDVSPLEKKVLEYFDFESWIESKLSGNSMVAFLPAKGLNG